MENHPSKTGNGTPVLCFSNIISIFNQFFFRNFKSFPFREKATASSMTVMPTSSTAPRTTASRAATT
jgi:hypothetical protein